MTIKNLRIHFQGKSYDLAVEVLGEPTPPAAAPQGSSVIRAVAPPPGLAPAAPIAPTFAAPVEEPPPVASEGGTPVSAPLSGIVVEIHIQVGQMVKYGDLLVTMEAMKMNTAVRATADGKVSAIKAKKGAAVEEGTTLVVLSLAGQP